MQAIHDEFETRGIAGAGSEVRSIIARSLCVSVFAIAGLALIGWHYDLRFLKSLSP